MTTTLRKPPPSTLPEWLAKYRKGVLVAELDEQLKLVRCRRFAKLRTALRHADGIPGAWGLLVLVIDLATKERLFAYHHLGSVPQRLLEEMFG